MKTYTYSYQNGPCLEASTDGLCRGREAGRVPAPSSVRVGAYRIRPPDGPERGRIHVPGVGAYRIRPPKRAHRPEWDVPGRAVGPVDHSPGRNPGRQTPGRRIIAQGETLGGTDTAPPPTGRMHVPGRAVGPADHSPGRNPGQLPAGLIERINNE